MENTDSFIIAIMQTFAPAKSADETTHWFSTDDVYEAVKGIDPGCELSKDDVFEAMSNAGFRFQNRPGAVGLQFRWMLKAKS